MNRSRPRPSFFIISSFFIIIVSCILHSAAFCQSPKSSAFNGREPFITSELWSDFKELISSPDFYIITGGLGLSPTLAGASFRNEEPEFSEMWSSQAADNIFEGGATMGNALYPVAASGLFYIIGRYSHHPGMERFGSHMLRAQALNGLFTATLKGLINRPRPDGTPFSYPSGHSSTAFACAGVIYYDLGAWFGVPAFAAASYVGLSRLQENKHYMSDIIAGAVLGTYLSYKITHRESHEKGLSFGPALIKDAPGAEINLRF